MAEINLGKVRGDDVTKQSIISALGFPVKEIVIIWQSEYDALLPHELEGERLFFIKDKLGKIFYKNQLVWGDDPWDGTFADPLVGQILFDKGLIANPTQSTREELAEITYFAQTFNDSEITKFPELQYCTSLVSMNSLFTRCTSLTEAPVIPNSITDMSIAFYQCSSLTEAPIIPNSVTNLSGAFSFCDSLIKAPTIPGSVTNLTEVFRGCSSLNGRFIIEAVIPPTINQGTFYGVTVVSIEVPPQSVQVYKTASEWSDYADKIFSKSSAIVFADPLVGQILFDAGLIANPTQSTREELAGITDEDMRAYYEDWEEVTSIFVESTITTFNEFQYFTGLTVLTSTFDGCKSLVEAPIIPNSVTSMNSTFDGCESLVEAPIIPDSVTSMRFTFNGCTSLIEAPIIPDSVTNMNSTFARCTSLIEAPVIPHSVTDMNYTFSGCSSLNGEFIIEAVTPPTIHQNTFSDVTVVSIKVPAQSVEAYKTAEGWSDYADKIFLIE